MPNNTRHLTGIVECACRNCAPIGSSWRAYVKRDTRRAVRRTARSEINGQINDDTDHNGDADYLVYTVNLNMINLRNLR